MFSQSLGPNHKTRRRISINTLRREDIGKCLTDKMNWILPSRKYKENKLKFKAVVLQHSYFSFLALDSQLHFPYQPKLIEVQIGLKQEEIAGNKNTIRGKRVVC